MSIASRFYMRIHDGSQKKDTRKECLKLDYGNLLRGGDLCSTFPVFHGMLIAPRYARYRHWRYANLAI